MQVQVTAQVYRAQPKSSSLSLLRLSGHYFVAVCFVPFQQFYHLVNNWMWVLNISTLKHEIEQVSSWANVFSILSKFHLSKCPNEQNKIGQNILGKCLGANVICATDSQLNPKKNTTEKMRRKTRNLNRKKRGKIGKIDKLSGLSGLTPVQSCPVG